VAAPSWSRRVPAILATAGAIVLAVLAARSTAWLVTGSGSGFGLRSLESCSPLGCDLRPAAEVVAELGRASPQLVRSGFVEAGVVTWIALWASAAALGLSALPMIAGVRSGLARAAARLALLALVTALAAGVVFVMRRPGGGGAYSLGLGFWLFGAGNVLGLVAGQMLVKLHAPTDPG